MVDIEYIITGTFTPFLVILRDSNTNLLVDSDVIHQSGNVEKFTDVVDGLFTIEIYDSRLGFASVPVDTTAPTVLLDLD